MSKLTAIKWLPQKDVDHELVKSYLELSRCENQFSNGGPVVKLLQQKLIDFLQISNEKSVILTSHGTMAIQAVVGMLSRSLDRKVKVATQSFTFPSSALLNCCDATIVDVDEGGGPNLTQVPDGIDVLVVTNVFGHCVDVSRYESFCNEKGIFLLFDNAASAFTFIDGKNICNAGDASIVSLHHTKPFGFGEGGAIIVDKKLANEINDIIGFGLGPERQTWSKFAMNARMSDVSAAYILQYIERNFKRFQSNATFQNEFFQEIHEKGIMLYPSHETSCCLRSCLPILVDHVKIEKFLDAGIEAKKYYKPLDGAMLANELYAKIVCLPFHVDVKTEDLDLYRSLLFR